LNLFLAFVTHFISSSYLCVVIYIGSRFSPLCSKQPIIFLLTILPTSLRMNISRQNLLVWNGLHSRTGFVWTYTFRPFWKRIFLKCSIFISLILIHSHFILINISSLILNPSIHTQFWQKNTTFVMRCCNKFLFIDFFTFFSSSVYWFCSDVYTFRCFKTQ
jgi:hypothetical protein